MASTTRKRPLQLGLSLDKVVRIEYRLGGFGRGLVPLLLIV